MDLLKFSDRKTILSSEIKPCKRRSCNRQPLVRGFVSVAIELGNASCLTFSSGNKLPPSVQRECIRFELIGNICKRREVNGGKLRKLESSFVRHLIKNPFLIQHNEIIVFGWINFQFSFPKWMSEWSGQLISCSLNQESFERTFLFEQRYESFEF